MCHLIWSRILENKLHAVLSLYVHACNCVCIAKIEFALGCFHTQGDLFTVQWIFFPFVFKWLESYKRNSEVLFLLTLLHKSSLNLQVKKKVFYVAV